MKTNRIANIAWAGAFAALATIPLMSAGLRANGPAVMQEQGVVTAREFRLVDAAGRIRAHLSLGQSDITVFLELSDAVGRPKILFAASPEGPFSLFFDKDSSGAYNPTTPMPSIGFVDARGVIRALSAGGFSSAVPSASPLHGLPPVAIVPNPFGTPRVASSQEQQRSAQSVSPADVDALRSEIDRLNARVNELAGRLNLLVK